MIVGEQGPEFFVPDVAGSILPNDLSAALAGADGGITSNLSLRMNIDAGGAGPDVEDRIRRVVTEMWPQMLNQAVQVTRNSILNSASRGGAFARMKRV